MSLHEKGLPTLGEVMAGISAYPTWPAHELALVPMEHEELEQVETRRSKYHREITKPVIVEGREVMVTVSVDVYDVLRAWNVTNPALAHLIKKGLQPGECGHKTLAQDMQDIVDSAIRARELTE